MRELAKRVGAFGAGLGESALVIQAFKQYSAATYQEVCNKAWPEHILEQMKHTTDPFMLIIKVDFGELDPNSILESRLAFGLWESTGHDPLGLPKPAVPPRVSGPVTKGGSQGRFGPEPMIHPSEPRFAGFQITADTYGHLFPGAAIAWADRLDRSSSQQQTTTGAEALRAGKLANTWKNSAAPARHSTPDMLIQSCCQFMFPRGWQRESAGKA